MIKRLALAAAVMAGMVPAFAGEVSAKEANCGKEEGGLRVCLTYSQGKLVATGTAKGDAAKNVKIEICRLGRECTLMTPGLKLTATAKDFRDGIKPGYQFFAAVFNGRSSAQSKMVTIPKN